MAYESARYQVEKIFTYPIEAALTAAADVGNKVMNRHIHIGKLGIMVSTTLATETTAPVIAILEGATVLATLTIADGTTAGTDVSVATDITVIDAGDTITFNVNTAGAGAAPAGAGYIYITYKERFSL